MAVEEEGAIVLSSSDTFFSRINNWDNDFSYSINWAFIWNWKRNLKFLTKFTINSFKLKIRKKTNKNFQEFWKKDLINIIFNIKIKVFIPAKTYPILKIKYYLNPADAYRFFLNLLFNISQNYFNENFNVTFLSARAISCSMALPSINHASYCLKFVFLFEDL